MLTRFFYSCDYLIFGDDYDTVLYRGEWFSSIRGVLINPQSRLLWIQSWNSEVLVYL